MNIRICPLSLSLWSKKREETNQAKDDPNTQSEDKHTLEVSVTSTCDAPPTNTTDIVNGVNEN